jgi:DNA invertase Pin-like site-specific DNA recombinase
MTHRAGIYARISEDRDGDALGVRRQVADCEQLAAQRGWTVAERYVDDDISAYNGKPRPEYRRMLADITDGAVEAVVVWHLDRLHRQPRELEEFFDVCDRAGGTALATVSGDVDLATHDGRFHARIMGAVAAKSSDDMSRRLRRKAQELAHNGQPSGGGSRPFGFEVDRVTVREPEATMVREFADRLLAGETLRGLATDLNTRGIPTPTGGRWSPTPLRRMLRSARISGQREHRGEIVATATWPAIITPEQTTRIRAMLDDPTRQATRPARSYLLKGLVRCGRCDAVLVARPRDDGRRRYVCARGPQFTGCGHTYVLAEPLEQLVSGAVLHRLDTPELAEAIRGDRERAAQDEHADQLDELTGRMDELAAAYAAGAVSMREWLAAREPLQRQLDAARRRVARDSQAMVLAEHAGRGGALRERWVDLSLERRHAIIAAVLDRVIAGPGRRGYNRFDPSRFELVWRH